MNYLTCNRGDRIGMNIYARLVTMSFCYNNSSEYTYVHTPLAEPFESMFNLGVGYMKRAGLKGVKNPPFCTHILELVRHKKLPNFSDEFKRGLIQRYKSPPKKGEGINICIHMRRGDAADPTSVEDKYKLRRSSDDFLEEVFQKISEFVKKPANITIHSDSALDMKKFETHKLNVNTNFQCEPEEAMRDMISCDILFRSGISAFSGVCAFYNKNLIISDMPDGLEELYAAKNTYALKDFSRIFK